jgi:membrane protein DedA with SNARE-associated domain
MFSFFQSFNYDPLIDFIDSIIEHQGILAPILFLIIEESGVPLPIPGDIVIAYTGYQVSKGAISYSVAFMLLLMAVLLGSSILYYLSSHYGQKIVLKFGEYIDLDEKKLLIVEEKFRKYGPLVIIIGRHIPGFRIPITVFSGMSHIKYRTFILSTFISVIIWIPVNLSLGQQLGPKTVHLLHGHPEYYLVGAIPFLIACVSYILFRIRRKRAKVQK